MFFHKAQEKPRLYGSFQDRQYSIWRNLEDIYQIDHKSEVLIMPGFWGLPPRDYSKFGNYGTNNGTIYKDGSLFFGGTDNYIDYGTSPAGGLSKLTVQAWIKPADSTSRMIIEDGTGYETNAFYFYLNTGRPEVEIYSNGFDHRTAINAISTTNFTHMVLSWKAGERIKLYVNGNEETGTLGGSLQTEPLFVGNANLTIGGRPAAPLALDFSGIINEARMSNTVYTADQIALFHDRPWDLYRRVGRPVWSIPAVPPAIMHFHKAQQKPQRWGNFQDVQYAIRKNSEKIYGCDPDDDVLVMPLFWGLPPMDFSGQNNHGENHGATYKDGNLDFNGSSNYIDTPYKHSGAGSISLWIKLYSLTGEHLFAGHNDGNDRRFYIGIENTDTFYGFGDTYEKTGVGTPQSHGMTTGNWYHLVLTGDGSTARYYVNNSEIDTLSYSWNAGTSANNFYIGAALSGIMVYVYSSIAEMHISNIARTVDQIALFHDRPWDLYRRVARPIWSIPAAGVTIPIFMQNMRGNFNSPGTRGGFIN